MDRTNWKALAYVFPLAFWVISLAPQAWRYPTAIHNPSGLPYWVLLWPFAISLAFNTLWPTKSAWWATAVIWTLLMSRAWTHTGFGFYDNQSFYISHTNSIRAALYFLLKLIIPLVIHFILRPTRRNNSKQPDPRKA